MKRTLLTVALVLLLAIAGGAQTHVGAMLDGTQPFTATQTFQSFVNIVWSDTGSVNAYSVCPLGLSVPGSGSVVSWTTSHPNTAASTLSICGGAAHSITKGGTSSSIVSGDITAGQVLLTIFDGAEWQLMDPAVATSVFFKTNGGLNGSQAGIDIESTASLNCQNVGTPAWQVQCSVYQNLNVMSVQETLIPDTGSANVYSGCSGSPNPTFTAGLHVSLQIANTNTGASTFNFCGFGAVTIVKAGGSGVVAGDLVANQVAFMIYTGSKWQLTNPASTASGTVANQQQGQPTVGASTSSTLTTEPAVFVAQAFSGADTCAKINLALQQCPTATTNACKIIVDAASPGSIDVCSTSSSNFWSGINSNVMADIELRTVLQVKRPVVYPARAHITHGIGSNQTTRCCGFVMDPTFSDPNNYCTWAATHGPFPAGTYNCMVIDGGTNFNVEGFGGVWQDISFDCNYIANCIPFYTGNMQEGSGFFRVRVWDTAANSGTSVSACGFWDHSVAGTNNSGPSHFRIEDSFCDPYPGSTGTTTNNTALGWVYEACCGAGGSSGGNIKIDGGTMRGASATQLMDFAVWIDGGATASISNIHCEWQNTNCIGVGAGGNGSAGTRVSNISDVNHASNAVHFYTGSTGSVAMNIESGSTEVQDDINSCSTSGSSNEFYTTDDGGQGWWNNSFHVCGSGNTDKTGTLAFSSATSATYNFSGTYSTAPQCRASFAASPGTTGVWTTTTTTVLTIHTTAAFTGNINYSCDGRGN
jgi:hypothetical protein